MLFLYVAPSRTRSGYDKGSELCLRASRKLDLEINVQDVQKLRAKKIELPPWLDGTPILVDSDMKRWKGSQAVAYLEDLVLAMENGNELEIDLAEVDVDENGTEHLSDGPPQDPADDVFSVDKTAMRLAESASTTKVTESDLHKYMELRNSK